MLKGISLPSLGAVASDALAILSVTPISVSPNGQLAVVDCLYTNGIEQLHAFLLLDLISEDYSTNYNTILGLGDETSVKSFSASVTWVHENYPRINISYEDLTDKGSANIFNRVGSVENQSLVSADLIEEVADLVADGSINKIVSDETGKYIAFETAATNLSPAGSLDTNTVTDVYLIDVAASELLRVTALEDGTEAYEETKLQDIKFVNNKLSVLFSTTAATTFSASDTNTDHDLYLWQDGMIKLISSNSDGAAGGYDGGIAAFFEDEIGFLATDLIVSDTDGLKDLYYFDVSTSEKRIHSVVDSFEFGAASDLWIEGVGDTRIILGSENVILGKDDLSNQLLKLNVIDANSEIISISSGGAFGNDISFAGEVSNSSDTVIFQTTATNLVSGLDTLGLLVNHTNTVVSGPLNFVSSPKVGEVVIVNSSLLIDPDGFGVGSEFSWDLDGVILPNEESDRLSLTDAMEGKDLSVTLSYTDDWGNYEVISLEEDVTVGPRGTQFLLDGKLISHGSIGVLNGDQTEQVSGSNSYFDVSGHEGFAVALSAEMYQSDITVSDVIFNLKHIIGLVTLTGKSALAGDVNNDGAIDISDAIMQLRHIVGLDEIDKFDLADAFDESPVNLNTNNERLELVLNGDVNLSTQLNPLYYEII